MVEVTETITRDGTPIIEVKAQYLYQGSYSDYKNIFQRRKEVLMALHMRSAKDGSWLISRSWFHPYDPSVDPLHKILTFRLESVIHFKRKTHSATLRPLALCSSIPQLEKTEKWARYNIALGGVEETPSLNSSSTMALPRRSHTCSKIPFF